MATATTTTESQIQSPLTAVNDPSFVPRGPVTVPLYFYSPPTDGSKPYNYVEAPPEGSPQRNYGSETHSVPLSDMRGQESTFSLDKHAFLPLTSIPSTTTRATFLEGNDAQVERDYYPEIEKLLLTRIPGQPHRVLIFDHTIRRPGPDAKRGPVARTHIDQTPASARERVSVHVPDPAEAEKLLKGRVRLINVWRPLNRGPVQGDPLAVADSTSVEDTELVGIEHRYPDRTGETASVGYTADQRWWYWSGMDGGVRQEDADEVKGGERLLLQCFDSEEHGAVGRGHGARVPHTAFVDPRTPEGAEGRSSIEVRALVFG